MKLNLFSEVTLTDLSLLHSFFPQMEDASHSLVVGRVVDSGGSPNAGGAMSPH